MGEDVNTRKHSMAVEAVRSVDTVKVYEGKQPNTGKRWAIVGIIIALIYP